MQRLGETAIPGILPFLGEAVRRCSLDEFAGSTIAIDANRWLYKGALECAKQIFSKEDTDIYMQYCMYYIHLLKSRNIKPILVFDGQPLFFKKKIEQSKALQRYLFKLFAYISLAVGDTSSANRLISRTIKVSYEMVQLLIKQCKRWKVDYIVAPFGSDAQLAYLSKQGIAQAIITDDTNLIMFGCNKILYKFQSMACSALLVEIDSLYKVMQVPPEEFNFTKFRYMCLLSGSDYLKALPGMTLEKALVAVEKPVINLYQFLRKFRNCLKRRKLDVPKYYIQKFRYANARIMHQIVFDPTTRKLQPLTNPRRCRTRSQLIRDVGLIRNQDLAFEMALGNIHHGSLVRIDKEFEGSICSEEKKLESSNDDGANSNEDSAPSTKRVKLDLAQPSTSNAGDTPKPNLNRSRDFYNILNDTTFTKARSFRPKMSSILAQRLKKHEESESQKSKPGSSTQAPNKNQKYNLRLFKLCKTTSSSSDSDVDVISNSTINFRQNLISQSLKSSQEQANSDVDIEIKVNSPLEFDSEHPFYDVTYDVKQDKIYLKATKSKDKNLYSKAQANAFNKSSKVNSKRNKSVKLINNTINKMENISKKPATTKNSSNLISLNELIQCFETDRHNVSANSVKPLKRQRCSELNNIYENSVNHLKPQKCRKIDHTLNNSEMANKSSLNVEIESVFSKVNDSKSIPCIKNTSKNSVLPINSLLNKKQSDIKTENNLKTTVPYNHIANNTLTDSIWNDLSSSDTDDDSSLNNSKPNPWGKTDNCKKSASPINPLLNFKKQGDAAKTETNSTSAFPYSHRARNTDSILQELWSDDTDDDMPTDVTSLNNSRPIPGAQINNSKKSSKKPRINPLNFKKQSGTVKINSEPTCSYTHHAINDVATSSLLELLFGDIHYDKLFEVMSLVSISEDEYEKSCKATREEQKNDHSPKDNNVKEDSMDGKSDSSLIGDILDDTSIDIISLLSSSEDEYEESYKATRDEQKDDYSPKDYNIKDSCMGGKPDARNVDCDSVENDNNSRDGCEGSSSEGNSGNSQGPQENDTESNGSSADDNSDSSSGNSDNSDNNSGSGRKGSHSEKNGNDSQEESETNDLQEENDTDDSENSMDGENDGDNAGSINADSNSDDENGYSGPQYSEKSNFTCISTSPDDSDDCSEDVYEEPSYESRHDDSQRKENESSVVAKYGSASMDNHSDETDNRSDDHRDFKLKPEDAITESDLDTETAVSPSKSDSICKEKSEESELKMEDSTDKDISSEGCTSMKSNTKGDTANMDIDSSYPLSKSDNNCKDKSEEIFSQIENENSQQDPNSEDHKTEGTKSNDDVDSSNMDTETTNPLSKSDTSYKDESDECYSDTENEDSRSKDHETKGTEEDTSTKSNIDVTAGNMNIDTTYPLKECDTSCKGKSEENEDPQTDFTDFEDQKAKDAESSTCTKLNTDVDAGNVDLDTSYPLTKSDTNIKHKFEEIDSELENKGSEKQGTSEDHKSKSTEKGISTNSDFDAGNTSYSLSIKDKSEELSETENEDTDSAEHKNKDNVSDKSDSDADIDTNSLKNYLQHLLCKRSESFENEPESHPETEHEVSQVENLNPEDKNSEADTDERKSNSDIDTKIIDANTNNIPFNIETEKEESKKDVSGSEENNKACENSAGKKPRSDTDAGNTSIALSDSEDEDSTVEEALANFVEEITSAYKKKDEDSESNTSRLADFLDANTNIPLNIETEKEESKKDVCGSEENNKACEYSAGRKPHGDTDAGNTSIALSDSEHEDPNYETIWANFLEAKYGYKKEDEDNESNTSRIASSDIDVGINNPVPYLLNSSFKDEHKASNPKIETADSQEKNVSPEGSSHERTTFEDIVSCAGTSTDIQGETTVPKPSSESITEGSGDDVTTEKIISDVDNSNSRSCLTSGNITELAEQRIEDTITNVHSDEESSNAIN